MRYSAVRSRCFALALCSLSTRRVLTCCIIVYRFFSAGSITTARLVAYDRLFRLVNTFGFDAKGSAACSFVGTGIGLNRRVFRSIGCVVVVCGRTCV